MSREQLRQLLGLPKDSRVVDVSRGDDPARLFVIIESDSPLEHWSDLPLADRVGRPREDERAAEGRFVMDDASPDVRTYVKAVVDRHVFLDATTCACGFGPSTAADWDAHRVGVAVTAIARWLEGLTSSVLAGDMAQTAAGWAAGRLVVAARTSASGTAT